MPKRLLGSSALCLALVGCVAQGPDSESFSDPDAAVDTGGEALTKQPRWPDDVRWSDSTPNQGGFVGDYDGDGRADLALRGAGEQVLYLARGTGDGRFGPPLLVRSNPLRVFGKSLEQADVNGDALSDLVYLSTTSDNDEPRRARLTSLLAQSDGQLGAKSSDFEGYAGALALAELTGDGHIDAIVAYGGTNRETSDVTYVTVHAGRGDGTFSAIGPARRQAGFNTSLARVGELTGDGVRDLVLAGTAGFSGVLCVLPGLPEGGFGAALQLELPQVPSELVLADLDSNGIDDVVVSAASGRSYDVLLFGVADAARSTPSEAAFGVLRLTTRIDNDSYTRGANVSVADVDGDGRLDLVIPGNDARNAWQSGYRMGPVIIVGYGSGDGSFRRREVYQLASTDSAFGDRIVLGDFDGDRQADLLLTTLNNDTRAGAVGVLLGPRN